MTAVKLTPIRENFVCAICQRSIEMRWNCASRNGEPFEAVIAKYGIPNQTFQPCNRELKLRPMDAYARSIGWEPGTYDTAIGIRADEMDRVNPKHKELRLIYPLIDMGITKADVLAWWRKQPFDLEVPEHLGNCRWCPPPPSSEPQHDPQGQDHG